jgi:hypothetical protein
VAGGEGFEPSTPNLGATKKTVDWEEFRRFLDSKNYRGHYGSQLFNSALRFSDCYVSNDLTRVKQLQPSARANIVKALSALAKFQGRGEEYKKLIKNYGLTWTGRSADDLIIDRMTKTDDPEEIWSWIRTVKTVKPELSEFMDLLAVTGLRFTEAYNSYNLIIQLTREKTFFEKYYNMKTGFLEHFRYRDLFIRSCKKAFISYVPLELLEAIGAKTPIQRPYEIRKILARRHVAQRFSDVRELNGSFLTKYLKEVEIDVMAGRVSGSVFKVHYLNVNLLTDLKARAAKGAAEILSKIAVNPEIHAYSDQKEVRKIE